MAALKNIAIVGVSGHVGGFITESLLAHGKHTITALTRAGSSSKVPAGVTAKTVDYGNPTTLVDALRGQDALIITMAAMAPPEQQTKLIEAAATAGVPWVLPNEWGSDTSHPDILKTPINAHKVSYRQQIEKLGKSNWIGVVNNQWWEWSLGGGFYGIDIPKRKAHLYDGGSAKTVSTTWSRVGEAVAKLLALPVSGASPCLDDFKNQLVYVASFYVSQREMLDAVQRNTGTTDKDWEITGESAVAAWDKALEQFKQGQFMAVRDLIYAGNFTPGDGNAYVNTKQTLNKLLDLPEENLDEATKRAIQYSADFKPGY